MAENIMIIVLVTVIIGLLIVINHIFRVKEHYRCRAENGEWYEADEDAMIVVRCGTGEQMMTQSEYERMKQKEDEDNAPVLEEI